MSALVSVTRSSEGPPGTSEITDQRSVFDAAHPLVVECSNERAPSQDDEIKTPGALDPSTGDVVVSCLSESGARSRSGQSLLQVWCKEVAVIRADLKPQTSD